MTQKLSILDDCTNMFGKLKPEYADRLRAVVLTPNLATWDDAYSIIVNGFNTLWQAVIAVSPEFPRTGPRYDQTGKCVQTWQQIPDQITLVRAIRWAVAHKR